MGVIQFPIQKKDIDALKTGAMLIIEGYDHMFMNGVDLEFKGEQIEEFKSVDNGKGNWGWRIITCDVDITIDINTADVNEEKDIIELIESFRILESE